MNLTPKEFDNLRGFIYGICGLAIPDEKHYLVRQRLEPLVAKEGCDSFDAFYQKMSRHCPLHTREEIITTMTTHETSFFRDKHFFETFGSEILPCLAKLVVQRKMGSDMRQGTKVRIWSAASSTGQEAYSIAMLIHEYTRANAGQGVAHTDFEILSTDISVQVLTQAIAGKYSRAEIERGLPIPLRDKYFRQENGHWYIDPRLRQMVEFRQINLISSLRMLGMFDVIFCRNVLIYFDDKTKSSIFDQFSEMLTDDGYLILGATENTFQMTKEFESVRYGQSLVYRKRKAVLESLVGNQK